jgi:SRSO17 transposase
MPHHALTEIQWSSRFGGQVDDAAAGQRVKLDLRLILGDRKSIELWRRDRNRARSGAHQSMHHFVADIDWSDEASLM